MLFTKRNRIKTNRQIMNIKITHTITRSGEMVKVHTVNQFKSPTITSHNKSIWMHSIDRKSNQNDGIVSFFLIIALLICMYAFFYFITS